jgi:hypothetical protein
MGKIEGNDNFDEEGPSKSKSVGKLGKSLNIKKVVGGSMDLEGSKKRSSGGKFRDKVSTVARAARKRRQDPEAMRKFDRIYEASVSTKTILTPGTNKGKRRRIIKKEKLAKKKVCKTGNLFSN